MEIQSLNTKIVSCFDRHGYFLNRTHVRVASGAVNFYRRRLIFFRLNKIVITDTDGLTAIECSHMIGAVLLYSQPRTEPVPATSRKLNFRSVVEYKCAMLEWPVS